MPSPKKIGIALLRDPPLRKGTAFTEREVLALRAGKIAARAGQGS
jgi:hypothetical protein